jgi:hypothetical protein
MILKNKQELRKQFGDPQVESNSPSFAKTFHDQPTGSRSLFFQSACPSSVLPS